MIEGTGWGYNSSNHSVRVIWEVSGGGGYEWSVTAIVRNSTGEYALYHDGGCSCNGAYDDPPESYNLSWNPDILTVIRETRSAIRDMWDITDGESRKPCQNSLHFAIVRAASN